MSIEDNMITKSISSTEAQNNFGRILDDVVQNDVRYIIKRRNASQVIVLGLADFEQLLAADENKRREIGNMIRELSPIYDLGEAVTR
jgi:prevent-host-death family protein